MISQFSLSMYVTQNIQRLRFLAHCGECRFCSLSQPYVTVSLALLLSKWCWWCSDCKMSVFSGEATCGWLIELLPLAASWYSGSNLQSEKKNMLLFSSNNALLRDSYWHVVKRSIGEQPLCIWRQTLRTGLTSTLVGNRSLGMSRVDCKLATFCAASDGKFRQYDGISVWVATKSTLPWDADEHTWHVRWFLRSIYPRLLAISIDTWCVGLHVQCLIYTVDIHHRALFEQS